MASNNIFAVIQSVAENSDSQVKLFNILKENGYTGTLEEAGNELTQASQAMLENLTSEDLKNIAGGKSLMTDKLKKIIAVGGASLMAGTAAVPTHAASGTQAGANSTQTKAGKNIINHMKENPIHSTATAALGLTAIGSLLLNIIQATKTGTGPAYNLDKSPVLADLKKLDGWGPLIEFINLDLQNTDSLTKVKFVAYTDQGGTTAAAGENAGSSYAKIEAGSDSQGLCATGKLLEELKDKIVRLDRLATYLVYKLGGKEKKTVDRNYAEGENSFKEVGEDKTLESYSIAKLNEQGQVLASLIIEKLLASQQKYAAA